jgi:hypothetical protein
MASKLALAAFLVLLGLARLGASWLGSGTAEGLRPAASLDAANSDAPGIHAAGGARGDHIVWNAACWLIGIGFAVSLGRREAAQPALD